MTGRPPAYNARKAAQVIAFFALKNGGQINVLKVIKLAYLAERESMSTYDEPMFYDRLVSMDHGPVPSITLNLTNGLLDDENWNQFIDDRAGYEVAAKTGIGFDGLDELSKADLRILERLWSQFGSLSKYQVRDYTHENCPEWEDPNGSSKPITHERVFKFLKKANSGSLAKGVRERHALSAALAEAS